ncbi:hypothetical protein ES705_09425 [subsurface metagenome]
MPTGKFEFRGKGGGYLWLVIWTSFLCLITSGLFYPWAFCASQKWIAEHTSIDEKQLVFKGTGIGIFGTWLLILLLSVITLGIYAPWGYCRLMRWKTNNLYFAEAGDVEHTG